MLELKGKLGPDLGQGVGAAATAQPGSEVLQALLSLGYSEKEALLAIKQISSDTSVSEGIRQGLKYLSKV